MSEHNKKERENQKCDESSCSCRRNTPYRVSGKMKIPLSHGRDYPFWHSREIAEFNKKEMKPQASPAAVAAVTEFNSKEVKPQASPAAVAAVKNADQDEQEYPLVTLNVNVKTLKALIKIVKELL